MLFSNHKEVINKLLANSLIKVIVVITFLISFWLSNYGIPKLGLVQKILMIILILCLFIGYEKKYKFIILNNLAKFSFGIFFIHGYLIAAFTKLNIITSNFFSYIIISLIVLIISYWIVYLMVKVLNKKSRYIIGC